MNPMAGSFFIGRFFNINVRIHFTLIFMMLFRIQVIMQQTAELGSMRMFVAVAVVFGLFLSILLHEFGHSLACKLFRGEATEILMWPLGGLAYCRPPHHPTAHFITTICGPLVTLIIWLILGVGLPWMIENQGLDLPLGLLYTLILLGHWNLFLLLFNLLPGFPMDGGRMLRDGLWHFIGYRKATIAAVWGGRITGAAMILAGLGLLQGVDFGPLSMFFRQSTILAVLGGFILWQNWDMERSIALGHAGDSGYSLKEHMKQAKRRSEFTKKMAASESDQFHACKKCGITDQTDPDRDFRVSIEDGDEYCTKCLADRSA